MSRLQTLLKTVDMGELVTTATSLTAYGRVFDLQPVERYSIFGKLDVDTPAAHSFEEADVSAAADTITEAAHGLTTGLKGQFTTTTTLPAGLSLATDYFIVVVDANTYKVATSLANALAGTVVNITDDGTGTHTFTPTALAGGFIKVQKSNKQAVFEPGYVYNSADWTDIAAATAVTADADFWIEVGQPDYVAALVHVTLTAGRVHPTLYFASRSFA